MDSSIIELKEVYKNFKHREVLKNLSLNVRPGSVIGLLGRNGMGKTTLIKTILGLQQVSSGFIQILGDDPWTFKADTKARIGYVPQSDRVYPWLRVDQLIQYTASFYSTWNHDLVRRLVADWNIDTSDKYGLLSEGQAQMVANILALGQEPDLLVLDEPVASLDPAARRQFLRMILQLIAERECTVFFSTHITSDLERVADHVAILKDGQIEFDGELDQLKDEVKRLRITTQHSLPSDITIDGSLHCDTSGDQAYLSVRGFNAEMKHHLEQRFNASVEVEHLNLEEIFLELNRT